MSVSGGKKLKLLYVLALFQLVAGPLVLMQVAVFCKLAVSAAPWLGVEAALVKTWHHPDFQAVLHVKDITVKQDNQAPVPEPQGKMLKEKMPLMAWRDVLLPHRAAFSLAMHTAWRCTWTPAMAQPPPVRPPRVG